MHKALHGMSEVFLSSDDMAVAVTRAVKAGTIRQIGPKLYTSNLTEVPEKLVRRHIWRIISYYMPDALVADRTALENGPSADGTIFVVSSRARDLELPGHLVRTRRGAGPVEGDLPFREVRMSSIARAYLDNLAPSRRRRAEVARTLSREELETKLDNFIRTRGIDAVNRLRDDAKRVAKLIGREEEAVVLDRMIGALLGTRQDTMISPQGRARSVGAPFDPRRVELFEKLYHELRTQPPTARMAGSRGDEGEATLCFFEAYFSNFIEGTEFEVEEAVDIVFNGRIPEERPEDAHDVLGTWRIVSDRAEMSRIPRNVDEFISLLRSRHAILMEARPTKLPGSFKLRPNRAGETSFVAPDEVEGTLARGFEIYQGLSDPFARATFMKFLVSEVHPFVDGNGRIARIMMNAELFAAGEERVIIPTVYRSNYHSSLKALSHNGFTNPVVRVLEFAQKWVGLVPWGELWQTEQLLQACNAFVTPQEAEATGAKLRLPDLIRAT